MCRSTLEVISSPQFSQRKSTEVSLVRAALFGAVVPPLLGTAAFMLLRMDNWTTLPFPFFLFFMFLQMSMFVSIVCAPFGLPMAVLCGLLMRAWLRKGDSVAKVQARLSGVGAVCGLAALWGVGTLFNGGVLNPLKHTWPLPFWGAALIVGMICGWLLPCAARSFQVTTMPLTQGEFFCFLALRRRVLFKKSSANSKKG